MRSVSIGHANPMNIFEVTGFLTHVEKITFKKGGKDGIFNNHHHRAQVFSRS